MFKNIVKTNNVYQSSDKGFVDSGGPYGQKW